MKSAERVDWRGRMEDLAHPHESFEKLRDDDNKSYHFNEHVENLKLMAAMHSDYPNPEKVYHAVIVAVYNEGIEILTPSIEAIDKNTFPSDRIIVVLAYEERGGEAMAQTARELHAKFKNTFKKD